MAVINAYGMKDSDGNTVKFRDDSGGGGGGSANSVRATYDTSPTTNSYSEGDYIYYNDTLYVAKTSITAGTALVVDTNIKDPDLPSDTIVSIDGLPGSGGGGGVTANDVSFDNTTSGLPATEVQTAIDEIDAEVDEITKRLSGQSNENLLTNGWFTINQRGQSSYSLASNTYIRTLDNWILTNVGGATSTLDVNSDGSVTLTNTNPTSTSYITLINRFEDYICKSLIGRQVTFSIKTDTGIYSKTWVPVAGSESRLNLPNGWFLGLITYPNLGVNENYVRVWSRSNVATPITIYAVKLEVGSVSTLAYDIAPDYAEELAKCQRYLEVGVATFTTVNRTDRYAIPYWYPFKVRKRISPAMTYYSDVSRTNPGYIYNAGSGGNAKIDPTESYASGDEMTIVFDANQSVNANTAYKAYYVASAEL